MESLAQHLHAYGWYAYLVLFGISFYESVLISLVAGALVGLGFFDARIAFGVLMIKDLLLDGFLYALGRWERVPRFFKRLWDRTPSFAKPALVRLGKLGASVGNTDEIEQRWRERPLSTMWIGKVLAYGLAPLYLVLAGKVRLSVPLFYLYAVPATVVQLAVLMTIGYELGISYIGEWIVSALLIVQLGIIVFNLWRVFRNWARRV
jgi:membrane protein DedA with SNARE-associated domain